MMGEYDKVLSDCRKALEALGTKLKSQGFQKEVQDEKGKHIVPDWERFLTNKDLGDIIGSINQKLYGFTSPGAHAGKSINREDADLSLMATYALVQFVISKLKVSM